jgi:hypothetical protein
MDEESAAPVPWTEATYLRSATRAIYQAVDGFDVSIHSVLPMMVISGRKPDSTLTTFAQQESIRIAEMPEWTIIQEIADNKISLEKLRDMSQSVLGLRARVEENATVPVITEAQA